MGELIAPRALMLRRPHSDMGHDERWQRGNSTLEGRIRDPCGRSAERPDPEDPGWGRRNPIRSGRWGSRLLSIFLGEIGMGFSGAEAEIASIKTRNCGPAITQSKIATATKNWISPHDRSM